MSKQSVGRYPLQHTLCRFSGLLSSLLLHSRGLGLHLVLLTEQQSLPALTARLQAAYSGALLARLLYTSEQVHNSTQ